MADKKTQKEHYLKIPSHILNLRDISLPEKVLLAHIYSFGIKDCYQSNATLAKIFMTSATTISRWIAKIHKFIYTKNPKGYYRTLWAKSHPEVQTTVELWYRGQKIPKPGKKPPVHFSKNAKDPMQKCATDFSKSAIRLTQKCVTTNNNTITETIKDTTGSPLCGDPATPSPLPAGGQAPALLTDRKKQMPAQIEQFKRKLGIASRRTQTLTKKQFEQRRQTQLRSLRG